MKPVVFLVAFIALLSTSATEAARSCPNPSTDQLYGMTCYEFAELPVTSSLTYESASAFCKSHNKTLAIIQGQSEQQLIMLRFNELGWNRAMIGLRFVRSGWKWADRAPLMIRGQGCYESKDIDWSKKSSVYSQGMTNEYCVAFCSKGGHQFAAVNAGLYCYCSEEFIWSTPASQCNLPCSGNSAQFCGHYATSYVFFTAEFAFDNWRRGRPTVAGSCAAVTVDGQSNEWVDVSCTYARPFMCRYDVSANVPPHGVTEMACGNNNTCYYLYKTPQLSWSDANRFCSKSGGYLATVDSQERQDMVNTMVSRLSNVSQIWIGGNNYDWYYPDGSIPSFLGWLTPDQPTFPTIHSCSEAVITALTTREGSVFGWKSRPCSVLEEAPNRFVCSGDSIQVATTGDPRRRGPPLARNTGKPLETVNYDILLEEDTPGMLANSSSPANSSNSSSQTAAQSNSTDGSDGGSKNNNPPDPPAAIKMTPLAADSQQERPLAWWIVLLIAVAAVILLALLVGVVIYLVKKKSDAKQRVTPAQKRQAKHQQRRREATVDAVSMGRSQTMLF